MTTHADETTIQNRQEADSAKVKRKRRLLVLTLLFALAAVAAVSAFFLCCRTCGSDYAANGRYGAEGVA